jgi:hypothetical protein
MKLSTYIEQPDAENYNFDDFRKQLVSFGLQVNYDLSADNNYIVKQKVSDSSFRTKLNYAIKNGVSPNILNLNGVIVNRDTNEIVCFGYEMSREVLSARELLRQRNGDNGFITEEAAVECLPKGLGTYPYITPNDLAKYTNDDVACYQNMIDGVTIRLYFDPAAETWRIGTGRAIDAAKSVWTGRSFHELFMETGYWKTLMECGQLNKRHCYMFIFCHPGNQQVYRHTTIRLYHVFTRCLDTMREIPLRDVDLGVPHMPNFTGVIEKPIDALSLMSDCTDTNQGIMIILKNGLRIPIMSREYAVISELRGNYANLRCRVLEFIHGRHQTMEQDFLRNFPTFKGYANAAKKAYTELFDELFKQIIAIKVRKSMAMQQRLGDNQNALVNSIWGHYRLDCRNKERQAEEAAKRLSKTPSTVPQQESTVVVNGVRLTRAVAPQQQEQKQHQKNKLTIEFVKNYIYTLPVSRIWEMLGEKVDVPHDDDWRD